jgi:hypothetical protein
MTRCILLSNLVKSIGGRGSRSPAQRAADATLTTRHTGNDRKLAATSYTSLIHKVVVRRDAA